MTVIGVNICCSVPNFIKIGRFFTKIWRFNDFNMAAVRHLGFSKLAVFFVTWPLSACHSSCFRVQNFVEIGLYFLASGGRFTSKRDTGGERGVGIKLECKHTLPRTSLGNLQRSPIPLAGGEGIHCPFFQNLTLLLSASTPDAFLTNRTLWMRWGRHAISRLEPPMSCRRQWYIAFMCR